MTHRLSLPIACLLLLALLSPALGKTEFIRLQNGSYVEGEIVSIADDGFTFVSKSALEPRFIPWRNIDPMFATQMRESYLLEKAEREMNAAVEEVPALRVTLKNGGVLFGALEGRDETMMHLFRRGMRFSISLDQIQSTSEELVDPREVYLEDDLLDRYVDDMAPETAEDFVELARFCRGMDQFPEALNAYRLAVKQNPEMAEALKSEIDLVEAMLKNESILAKYKDVCGAAARNDFEAARNMVKDELRASTSEDLTKRILDELERKRKDYLHDKIASLYFKKLNRECWRVSSFGYDNAMNELARMKEKTEEYVMEQLQIDATTFREVWDNRNRNGNKVTCRRASFGSGTFLSKCEGREESTAAGKPKRSGPIRIDPSVTASNSGTLPTVGQPDPVPTWWSNESNQARWNFLRARYAETYLEIENVYSKACTSCGGGGKRKAVNWDREAHEIVGWVLCRVCRGQGVYKDIKFH